MEEAQHRLFVAVTEFITNLDTLITTLEPVTSLRPPSAGANDDVVDDVTVTSPADDDNTTTKRKVRKKRKSGSRTPHEIDEKAITAEPANEGEFQCHFWEAIAGVKRRRPLASQFEYTPP